MVLSVVLATIAVILLLDAVVILVFRKFTVSVLKEWVRNSKKLGMVGISEIAIALILFVLAIALRNV